MSTSSGAGPGELPPAGWYRVPTEPGVERWWSGSEWTQHVRRPADGPTGQESPSPAGPGLQPWGPSAVNDPAGDDVSGFRASRDDHVQGPAVTVPLFGGTLQARQTRQLGPVGQLVFAAVWTTFVVFGAVVFLTSAFPSLDDPVATQAVVTEVQENRRAGESSSTCRLVYDLRLEDGTVVSGSTTMSTGTMCSRSVGDVLDVTYDRSDPSRVAGVDPGGNVALVAFFAVFAVAGVAFDVATVRRFRRHLRERRGA